MYSKELLLLTCLGLLGGLRLTSTTTTTTFVAAMSIGNQELERYFRTVNATQALATMTEDRIAMDLYTYAYLNYSYLENNEVKKIFYNEEKARYGEGRITSVVGKLVHISAADDITVDTACTPNIGGTLGGPTPAAGAWIALVRRGGCTFEEKVKNVHAKGAVGVIIYNDKPVSSLEKMQIKGKNRNITAVITYQEIGDQMAAIVDQGLDMEVAIIEGRSGMRPINSLNRTSVLFVSISFIVLMVISLVWLILYYIQRFRYLQTKDQQSRHLCSVTKKAIMKIPTKTGKSCDEKDADNDCCAICIETYKSSDCIRVLPCKHEFHKHCIDPWLIEHRTCPMCKLDVLKFYGYVFLGSEESILDIEPDRSTAARGVAVGNSAVGAAMAVATSSAAAAAMAHRGTQSSPIADLMRSRDFVIDFPRIFVLEAGEAEAETASETVFPERLPERSQSSLSLAHAKDWMAQMSNKLDDQHGLRRLRKQAGVDLHEMLLDVRADSVKRRRSRSADGRYSNASAERREQQQQQQQQQQQERHLTLDEASGGDERRGSAVLHSLTEAAYGQSHQRQLEDRRGRLVAANIVLPRPRPVRARLASGNNSAAPPVCDVAAITIQINGEGVDFE